VSNSGSLQAKGGGGAGKATFQDLSITKYIDRSSTDLLQLVATGKSVAEGILTVRKAGGDTGVAYVSITMKPVIVTSLSTGGSEGEDRLTENISLNFGAFAYSYTEQDARGGVLPPKTFAWDIAKNGPATF
jgi:type VI secretion system secreted protein Hcp